MSLKFSKLKKRLKTKKRAKKIKKIRQAKKSKLRTNEIKATISNNSIIKSKSVTQIFKFDSISEMCNLLDSIDPNIRLKLLINYNTNEYFVFKTEFPKKEKKKHKTKENNPIQENQLDSKEIAKLFKRFYSEDEFKFSDPIKNKQLSKKLKIEIAPKEFIIESDHFKTENRYANVISIEHINKSCVFEKIINGTNAWLSIDCYKINNEFILEKLNQMKADKLIEKKFTDSIIVKMDDVTEKLQEETVFQCEIRLLLYNNDLEQLKNDSELVMDNLAENYCTSYIPQEKINTRKLFEKSIYPNGTMDIIHSINFDELFNMIGSEENV